MSCSFTLDWQDKNLDEIGPDNNVFENWVLAVIPNDSLTDIALHHAVECMCAENNIKLEDAFYNTTITLQYNRYFDKITGHEFYDFTFWHETIVSDELYVFTIENNFYVSLNDMVVKALTSLLNTYNK